MIGLLNRKFYSFILLLLFLSVKGFSYHPLTHETQEDQLKCELCEVVILNDQIPVDHPPAIDVPAIPAESSSAIITSYQQPYFYTNKGSYSCRPPPVIG